MRLPEFIRSKTAPIINEWMAFASTLSPDGGTLTQLQLKDHIEQILEFFASDMESAQTSGEQSTKSKGETVVDPTEDDTASEIHGDMRQADGFDVVQMVSEYRALRASIIKLWTARNKTFTQSDMQDLTRFNESIDQSLAESVARFMEKVDYSRDLLLGILGHDIRSPLGAMTMSAHLLPMVGELNDKQKAFASQIEVSGARIGKIVTDLLDLTKSKLGTGLPIKPEIIRISDLIDGIVDEMRTQHKDNSFVVSSDKEIEGCWDSIRLGQVLSNLISNAVQYGSKECPISITATSEKKWAIIKITNQGDPIPSALIPTLFNSFTRGSNTKDLSNDASANLGLGLFISKEIINAHKGTIQVFSSQNEGTTFILKLPIKSV